MHNSFLNQQFGPYKIDSTLGHGAVATVYSVSQPQARPTVLKVLNQAAASHPKVVSSFRREFRITARLNHPGIVRVYDAGEWQGQLYIAMQYIDGETLDVFLKRHKKIGEAAAIDIVKQVADSLDHAHEQGIIHRDIKPSNIMLTRMRRRAILFDFGAALDLNNPEQQDEAGVYGTPSFVSPEQAQGIPIVDGRADFYSLGIVFYLMVTGRRPFYGTRDDVLRAHIVEEPTPPSEFAHLSPGIEAAILKLIAKKPDDRFLSGAELCEVLDHVELEPEKPTFTEWLRGWLGAATQPS